MSTYESELRIALQAAKMGGQIVSDNFDRTLHVQRKQYSEIVTNVDYEAEEAILRHLQAKRPEFGILSEESQAITGAHDLTWVVDPLDGTSNFVLGIPHVAVSIALCDGTETLVGVVVNPMRSLCYTAERGQGAMANKETLHVSQIEILQEATIAHIVGYEEKRKPRAVGLFTDLRSRCYRLLDTWAPSLDWCLLAQGKIDALVSLGAGKFDRLAGALIVREAGGLITDPKGNLASDLDTSYLLASNGTELHADLLDIVSQYYG